MPNKALQIVMMTTHRLPPHPTSNPVSKMLEWGEWENKNRINDEPSTKSLSQRCFTISTTPDIAIGFTHYIYNILYIKRETCSSALIRFVSPPVLLQLA